MYGHGGGFRGGGRGGGGGRGRGGGGRGGGRRGPPDWVREKYMNKGRRGSDSPRGSDEDQFHGPKRQSIGQPPASSGNSPLMRFDDLAASLQRIDGKGYGAYKDLKGAYAFEAPGGKTFTLRIDHVQGDAYAPPSRVHVEVPLRSANFPIWFLESKVRSIAACDFVARKFHREAHKEGADRKAGGGGGGWSGPKGGDMQIDCPSQHVLERTSVCVVGDAMHARFTVALPARGRSILGRAAYALLVEKVPRIVMASLYYDALDTNALRSHVESVEDQAALRRQIGSAGLIGFVMNGAVLPRESGASDKPLLASKAVPFMSPPSLQVEFTLPNRGKVRGMGIPQGVTLIVGGGFHGKSTLLKALEVGVYNHIPGDGREFVVAIDSAVKIRAEDGRVITNTDISPFINNLPHGKSTSSFSTPDASGSTSQAANIVEAIEAGTRAIMIDEDTAATNFMIRDHRMSMLVSSAQEPIVPFISNVQALYKDKGISSMMVIGGAGEYFEVADLVILMDSYKAHDVTQKAKDIVKATGGETVQSSATFPSVRHRAPRLPGIRPDAKTSVRSKDTISLNDLQIELGAVEQLVENSQVRAIADSLLAVAGGAFGKGSLSDLLNRIEREVDAHGLDCFKPGWYIGNYSRPRRFELAAALNRVRGAVFEQGVK